MFGMRLLICGNPVDGFEYYGPFKTGDDAIRFAEMDAHIDGDWWIAPIHAVEELQVRT